MSDRKDYQVIEVEAATVDRWMEDHEAVLVDVRETSEYEQEHITGSMLVPLSVFDAEKFPRIPGKKVVMHCAVGKRSAAAGKQLLKEGYARIYNLEGGIKAWKAAGLATEVQFVPPAVPDDLAISAQDRKSLEAAASGCGQDGAAAPQPVHPGAVLRDEFLDPLGLSQRQLAAATAISAGRIGAILRGQRAVTADTALRLARYFSTSEEFWMRLQMEHDLARVRTANCDQIRRDVTPRSGAKPG